MSGFIAAKPQRCEAALEVFSLMLETEKPSEAAYDVARKACSEGGLHDDARLLGLE
mgnify:FL=1|jgi:hypothetical protein|tara:strand:+ start:168 stop:335 length:168 start_codon:yes stop_codon:yes gene_type:complete